MAKKVIDGSTDNVLEIKSRNQSIEFDELQVYFGMPYKIDVESAIGEITIYQPLMGDIINFGENRFYNNLSIFTTNTTSNRVMLWDAGIDWNQMSDFELFSIMYKGCDKEATKLIFRDIDLFKFEPYTKQIPFTDEEGNESQKSELVLYDKENEIEINSEVYNYISQYLRNVFQIFPEEKITNDEMLKRMYINKDKRAMERKKENKKEHKSHLKTVISSCVNHPGFKYKLEEIKDMPVAQFYDSVSRLQIYEQTTACMKGMYSGFVDGSKLKPDNYNFMKEI